MFDVGDRDIPVPISGNWVIKGCVTKWLRFYVFYVFWKSKKHDFLRFSYVAHVFSNTAPDPFPDGTVSHISSPLVQLQYSRLRFCSHPHAHTSLNMPFCILHDTKWNDFLTYINFCAIFRNAITCDKDSRWVPWFFKLNVNNNDSAVIPSECK